MLFDTTEFRAMQSSVNALWMKQQAGLQNIANYETPGYKAKVVSFESVLSKESLKSNRGSYSFKAVVSDDEFSEVRPDGNNVNMEKENVELFQNYVHSTALYNKLTGKINDLKYVMENSFK